MLLIGIGKLGQGCLTWWDVEAWREIRSVETTSGARAISVSPDQSVIAVAEQHLCIRDMDDGRIVTVLQQAPYGLAGKSCFSADGALFAVAFTSRPEGGIARVWNTANWREIARFSCGRNTGIGVAFSKNGDMLTLGSEFDRHTRAITGRLRWWNLRTLQLVREVTSPEWNFRDVTVSPDSMYIAASGASHTPVTIWDSVTGEAVHREEKIGDDVGLALVFTRGGRNLIWSTARHGIRFTKLR